jgi:peptidylprolyl isomerase
MSVTISLLCVFSPAAAFSPVGAHHVRSNGPISVGPHMQGPDAGFRSASAAALAALLLLSPMQMPLVPLWLNTAVQAKELASGSGSRVNKDPRSLLRLGLPAQPKELRDVQASLEESEDNLNRLLYSNSKSALAQAGKAFKSSIPAIMKAVPATEAERATTLIATVSKDIQAALEAIAAGNGAAANAAQSDSLRQLSALEELIAAGYAQPTPPKEYAGLPYLRGRAEVEFVIKRPGEKFDVEGKLYDTVQLTTVIDGYTAPLTSGNFVDLVQRGFYNGMRIQRSDGFVVQTGDPSKEGSDEKAPNGYVPAGQTAVRKIPLEVFVKGDKQPMYGSTFDDDGRGGYASKLPFNAYGALGMAREEYDPDSASTQWFWLLFDSDLTPAGKNLLDGRYACFGYTVEGAKFLADVKEGDVITSAKVISGLDRLVTPQ